MLYRTSIATVALATAMLMTIAAVQAFDESKYPDLKGQWDRAAGTGLWDGKTAPLTSEYRAIFEANVKDQREGGQGTDPTYICLAPGMPRVMNAYGPFEIIVTPTTTHVLMDHVHDSRRIFTDGREWPAEIEPSFAGLSIGTWVDEDGDGRYDVLVVETRGLKGPRTYDASGLPFHSDNQTVVKERIYLDKNDRNTLSDEIIVYDNALTKPWSTTKKYIRKTDKQPVWHEDVCAEGNAHVEIAGQNYFLSGDGHLMPARKDQPPPDLKYFKQAPK